MLDFKNFIYFKHPINFLFYIKFDLYLQKYRVKNIPKTKKQKNNKIFF